MLPPTALWTAAVLLAAAVAVAALSPGGADAAFAFPNHESNEASRYLGYMPNFVEIPEVRSSRIIPFEDAEDEDRKITLQRRSGSGGGSYAGRQNRAGNGRSKLLMRIFKRGGGSNGMMRYGKRGAMMRYGKRAMMRYGRSSEEEEEEQE